MIHGYLFDILRVWSIDVTSELKLKCFFTLESMYYIVKKILQALIREKELSIKSKKYCTNFQNDFV